MELSTGSSASPGINSLAQLYGFMDNAAHFAAAHIDTLLQSDNPLAIRCGEVLKEVNLGFGVGNETALVLIGIGQRLLGNALTGTVLPATSANPIVMTCAAIGAIHYGYRALSDTERDQLHKTVGSAFQIGAELVRSIASFAYNVIQKVMSRENFEELKRLVMGAAEALGRHLSDITRLLSDRLREGAQYVAATAEGAASAAWAHVPVFPLPGRRKTNDPDEDVTK